MNKRKRKQKSTRIEPRADVERHATVTRVSVQDIPLEKISIQEWHPDLEAKLPAEQVHFIITIGDELKLALRFKSPDTLGFLIEELIAYRKKTWSDAEPINPDVELEDIHGDE